MSSDNRELFKSAARYYSKYRKGYPKELFDYLIRTFNLTSSSRVLDLGTGTGQIAISLSTHVQSIVAVDSEQEMLDEGKRMANKEGFNNVEWIKIKAEDISQELGSFRLTTIGAAFHWMDREQALRKIYEVTENGGGIAIISDSRRGNAPNQGEDWKEVRKKVIEKYLGERRRAGNSFFDVGDDTFEDRLTDSPFGGYQVWNYDFTREWTLEEAVNFLYSTSFASKRFFGDKLNEFEEELRSELLKLKPGGIFEEEVKLQVLTSKK
ncbi:MAG: class I SAM-dependent methyltransferase [Patescibacteria group bacterium]